MCHGSKKKSLENADLEGCEERKNVPMKQQVFWHIFGVFHVYAMEMSTGPRNHPCRCWTTNSANSRGSWEPESKSHQPWTACQGQTSTSWVYHMDWNLTRVLFAFKPLQSQYMAAEPSSFTLFFLRTSATIDHNNTTCACRCYSPDPTVYSGIWIYITSKLKIRIHQ